MRSVLKASKELADIEESYEGMLKRFEIHRPWFRLVNDINKHYVNN